VPSGDRSRTWFPEMVEVLRQGWRGDIGMDELIALANGLDCLLRDIRTKRGICSPTIQCRKCGKRGPAAAPRVSVRATILAAGRFGIGQQDEVAQTELLWNRYRLNERLDLYGRPTVADSRGNAAELEGCTCHT
jgi:hypothetical protein